MAVIKLRLVAVNQKMKGAILKILLLVYDLIIHPDDIFC
jgi:hypothetical protein